MSLNPTDVLIGTLIEALSRAAREHAACCGQPDTCPCARNIQDILSLSTVQRWLDTGKV
jgi:hypothetical protein